MDGIGGKVAGDFREAVRDDIGKINDAATRAAHDHVERARRSDWTTLLAAMFVSLGVAGILAVAALYWWIPARADVEAQKAEVTRLTATVAQLKQHGGDAQIVQCEARLCVRTDETGKAPKVADAKKSETYRVIKGYCVPLDQPTREPHSSWIEPVEWGCAKLGSPVDYHRSNRPSETMAATPRVSKDNRVDALAAHVVRASPLCESLHAVKMGCVAWPP